MAEPLAVGRAVRRARLAHGDTLRALAARLDVSPGTLSAIENGRTPLTVARLQRLAELLEVPAHRLLAGSDPAPASAPAGSGDWRDVTTVTMDPVLEAATRLFVRHGFHGTSMREIAVEARLSVAGVYHHYASKQQLLVAALDLTMSELRWRVDAARLEGRGPVESFAMMVEALALFHAVRGDLAFLGASEMRGLLGEPLERVVALRNQLQYAFDEQALLCVEAGEFHVAEVRTATRAVATMCTALPSWFRPAGTLTPRVVARSYAAYAVALMRGDGL